MGHMLGVTEQSERTHLPRVERIAHNEAAFRETNEQIDALNAAGAKLLELPIVSECGADDCVLVLTVDARKYDDVRAHPDRFLVKTGHEIPDVESVVEWHGEFVVRPCCGSSLTRSRCRLSASVGGWGCLTTIRLTIAEYETAREDPRFFVCEPGHEILRPAWGGSSERRASS